MVFDRFVFFTRK